MNLKRSLSVRWLLAPLFMAAAAFFSSAQAQTYGNEWIVPGQPYYKIGTTKTGIHRLTYDWLTANIPGVAGVNPQQFKLYRRGKQQSIYVQGEADGQLNQGDFIEFYGQRNDGKLDVELFKNPQDHNNPYYSMYTDTAAYFLTWSAGTGNRMAVNNPFPGGINPETYHVARATPFQVKDLSVGPALAPFGWPNGISRGPFYGVADNGHAWGDVGEGFAFQVFPNSNPRSYKVDSLLNVPQGADTVGLPKPTLRLVIIGGNRNTHKLDIEVGRGTTAAQLRKIASEVQFQDFQQVILTYTLNFKDLAAPTATAPAALFIKLSPRNSATTPDRVRLVLAEMTYPQGLNLAGKPRLIYPDPTKPSVHIEVTNPPADAIAYDITDLENVTRIEGIPNGSQESFVYENITGAPEPKVYIASGSTYMVPVSVRPAAFGSISAADRNYVIITHKTLMQSVSGSNNPVQEYADYRSSFAGGSYKPVIAEIEHVYDQFHYGEKSPMAIRNYIDYMLQNSELDLVFLLGKGLQLGFNVCTSNVPYRFNPGGCYEKDLVPTFGFPGSDLAYVMDFKSNDYHIKVPIGRIAAQSSQQVLDYLNKVKGYDQQPQNALWRKNILHLGGGHTVAELNRFRIKLQTYQAMAEGIFLGANVIERYKQNVVNPVESVDVTEEVNEGVSLITFFGHSSPTISDLDIGYVSNPAKGYNNYNKYPAIVMNGCATGSSYGGNNAPESDSFGEDWTLTPNKGAVIFMAHAYQGYEDHFHRFMLGFYEAAFKDTTYGDQIGFIHQNTVAKTLQGGIPSDRTESFIALIMQYALQGDPAVRLYGPQQPDYDVTFEGVQIQSTTGAPITAEVDSLKLLIPVQNLGKVFPPTDSVDISIKRTFADGTSETGTIRVRSIWDPQTVTYTFATGGSTAGGLNSFEVFVDNTNQYSEISESNNKTTLEHYIPLTGVATIFPLEFGIVPTQQVTLKGQANNLQTINETYIFEIDTTHTFTSNWKKNSGPVTANLLPTWTVDLLPNPTNDSVVYFWRVRYDETDPGVPPLWSTSSFMHIPNAPTGWAQGHVGQFKRDNFDGLELSESTRRWNFGQKTLRLDLKTSGGGKLFTYPENGIYINGDEFFRFNENGGLACTQASTTAASAKRFLTVVFDPVTLTPITSLAPNNICGDEMVFYTFPHMDSTEKQNEFAAFLNNVPSGAYVAMVSMHNITYSNFSTQLRQAFAGIGVPNISSVPNGSPYLLVTRKGDPNFAKVEKMANPADTTAINMQYITGVVNLSAPEFPGTVTSTVIGPAMSWGSLHHTFSEIQLTDEVQLSVIARSLNSQDSLYYADVNTNNFSLNNINATQYPYLKLQLTLKDSVQLAPAQLERWMVTYTPAPEGIIRADLVGFENYHLGTFEAGQNVTFTYKFQNISDVTFRDTVKARVTLTSDGVEQPAVLIPIGKLTPDSTATFTHTINTANLGADNKVLVFVNPRLQPEQYYTNNLVEASFKVRNDRLHPVIDVVFDGKHIMDGDIIAPNPNIVITLKDENRFRFKDDTAGVKVELVRNAGTDQESREVIQLHNNPEVQVQYATANSDFRIIYEPAFLPDGLYTLEVQGADKTGNVAGTAPYKISFRMVNASTITQFYPYPNPFSNSCRFVFTLTGQPELTKMKIQILTVTGKVVREITSAELGTFRAGDNITDFAWDGTDEFGDKLANGVYLYRVVIGDKGDNFKEQNIQTAKYQAEAEASRKAFKKGYGKLYILR